jgi:menaquinone-dependent protoporphyrinogen oxidase
MGRRRSTIRSTHGVTRMSAPEVLVAFASQTGSTAGIAQVIAAELRRAGLAIDCRPASEVADVTGYRAVILGSGVFLPRRASDGGGFLARHAADLAERRVWLFCSGPIGRGRVPGSDAPAECSVMDVARAIGARGAAAFGTLGLINGDPSLDGLHPVDHDRVRAWARAIGVELTTGRLSSLARGSIAAAS